jgi:hypothetical protein
MRGVALIAAGAVAGIATAHAAAGAQGAPALQAATVRPLVVVGAGFAPGERVTVTALTSLRMRSVLAKASGAGTFRARLGWFARPCGSPFAVRARGAAGSRASLRLPAAPCVPPPID